MKATKVLGIVLGTLLVAALFTGAAAASDDKYLGTAYAYGLYDDKLIKDVEGFKLADNTTWTDAFGNTVTFIPGEDGQYYIDGAAVVAEGDYTRGIAGSLYHIDVKMPTAAISGSVYKNKVINPAAPTDDDLKKAIHTNNENRKAMVELYDFRINYPGIISGVACSKIVQASMCMPKEEHTKLVKELIEELKEMAKTFTPSKKTKIIVSGSLCESCKDYVLDAVESCGGVIVYDDLYVGSRYFNTLYKEELSPMEAMIDVYVNPVSPCATKYEKRSIGDYQLELLEKTGAAGIVDVIVQNCEAHYYGYFMAHRKLTKAGKRDIELFVDMENTQVGQVKTRLQSFIESLEA